MNRAELIDALDGLHAYDLGATDSGIKDESLRARCIAELEATIYPGGPGEVTSTPLTLLVRDMWLTDEQIEAGYGLEDAWGFVRWLEERMEGPAL